MSVPKDRVPDPHADPLVASLLSAAAAAEGPGCPDAELLGLYADRDLHGDLARRIDAHVHDCARCQAIVAAYVRSLPEPAAGGVPAGVGGFAAWLAGWRWLVPAASLTAVAVVAVSIGRGPADEAAQSAGADRRQESAVATPERREMAPTRERTVAEPGESVEPPASSSSMTAPPADAGRGTSPAAANARSASADAGVAAEAGRVAGRATEAADAGRAAGQAKAAAKAGARVPGGTMAVSERVAGGRPQAAEVAEREERQDPPVSAADSRAPRAQDAIVPSTPASAPAARRQGAEVLGANDFTASVSVWRARDGRVERTRDNGTTWQSVPTPAGVTIRAVASPSPTVCWAIGVDAVLRTIDGTTWARTARPTDEPLTGVSATSASDATVVTATGAMFDTSDGGRRWSRVR